MFNDAREFETTNGASVFPEISEGRLLGRPILEAEGMDSTWGTGENYTLVFGSFDQYVIADRVGTTVEFRISLEAIIDQPDNGGGGRISGRGLT